MEKIPIVLVSGYIGSGKTTIINQIGTACKRPAVITYEPANVTLVEQIHDVRKRTTTHHHCSSLFHAKTVDEMLSTLDKLAKDCSADNIFIELAGTVEPYSIARLLENHKQEPYSLKSVLTVIDAKNFWFDFTSNTEVLFNEVECSEHLSIADVLVEQIEFCSSLILNKCSAVSKESSDELKWLLEKLQKEASIIKTTTGEIHLQDVLDENELDISKIKMSAGWISALMKKKNRFQLVDDYGIGSFIYERDIPFHPERFQQWFEYFPPEIIRSKGILWSISELDTPLLLSQAGRSLTLEEGADWDYFQRKTDYLGKFSGRKTELVFIGIDLNREEIIKQLDSCLVTSEELQQACVTCKSLLEN
ncbi:MAG: CobW family GTP-binding protein [Anaerobacillus sp.]|uniref:CobW family GTP-binding protein n=1 Tax=Anaerobacillus sp. TaxID=1872506 RepID=UPI003919152A